MYELAVLVLLVFVIVLSIRGGRPVVQEPVVINIQGQYHITLAPQLTRIQPFIEKIVLLFKQSPPSCGDIPGQYFEVIDATAPEYLLAISRRGGVLYFQAINPQPSRGDAQGRLNTLREFSSAVLAQLPLSDPTDAKGVEQLRVVLDSIAESSRVEIRDLGDS